LVSKREFDSKDKRHFMSGFVQHSNLIGIACGIAEDNKLLASNIIGLLKRNITTETKMLVALSNERILFDGLIGSSQSKSVIVYAFKGPSVKCAKVYMDEFKDEAQHEYDISQAIHSDQRVPSVVFYDGFYSLSKRHILLMDVYPRSLCDFMREWRNSSLSVKPIPNDHYKAWIPPLLDALVALNLKGICHGDIKESNVMLDRKGRTSLIDLGGANRFGQQLKESSGYGLDVGSRFNGTLASSKYDMVCLAVMLFKMNTESSSSLSTIEELRQQVIFLKSTDNASFLCLELIDHLTLENAIIDKVRDWFTSVMNS
jgi:serine/threonine protein kinase